MDDIEYFTLQVREICQRSELKLRYTPLKPRPNDCNISTQHIATFLGVTCWAPLPPCCDMLGVVGSNLKMVKVFKQQLALNDWSRGEQ